MNQEEIEVKQNVVEFLEKLEVLEKLEAENEELKRQLDRAVRKIYMTAPFCMDCKEKMKWLQDCGCSKECKKNIKEYLEANK